jgi:hypothetical protein
MPGRNRISEDVLGAEEEARKIVSQLISGGLVIGPFRCVSLGSPTKKWGHTFVTVSFKNRWWQIVAPVRLVMVSMTVGGWIADPGPGHKLPRGVTITRD